ncbi:MAG: DEAD/DEAH box helicase [Bacillota bacterium]|nr:MAG: DEAD/DEAH box helicase [Bacillota bacterium]
MMELDSDNIKASYAQDAAITIRGLGGELRPFQRAGVAYALRTERTFIADEPGLGKTCQALATIHASNAYPALVVSPASLKLNWQREAQRWLPGAKVTVLSGVRPDYHQYKADVVVCNYDILAAHQRGLAQRGFRGIVFDEAHNLKGRATQRATAARALVKRARVRLPLTGTPILNGPEEFASPLEIIERIDEFGGYAQFLGRYCGYSLAGQKVGPPAYLDELNRLLRSRCYVRRRKADVLKDLPPKTRAVVPISITNRRDYEEAERSLAAEDDQRRGLREAQQRAEADRLKGLVALGKIPAIVEWVKDFIHNGEKLVLFAYHKAVQHRLYQALAGSGAVHIFAEDDAVARQSAVDRFQREPKCKVIVCSLMAANAGLTLTAASNVAFAEMGWTPGIMDQATDRVHRIGQVWPVTAWYLLAPGTVDDDIYELIERKRRIVDAATDGQVADQTPLLRELIDAMRRRRG